MSSILVFGSTTTARQNKIHEILARLNMEEHENNPDLLVIQPPEKKTSIGIGQARELTLFLNEKPFQHKDKAVVVHKAELLTVQAQNALLKTLEEPPEYATIILNAKTEDSLLETVVSRCRKIRVNDTNIEKSDRPSADEILGMSVGNRLFWASEYSKVDREEVIETLDEWLWQLREKMDLTAAKNIEIISQIKGDLQHTNVSLKLALENLVLTTL